MKRKHGRATRSNSSASEIDPLTLERLEQTIVVLQGRGLLGAFLEGVSCSIKGWKEIKERFPERKREERGGGAIGSVLGTSWGVRVFLNKAQKDKYQFIWEEKGVRQCLK